MRQRPAQTDDVLRADLEAVIRSTDRRQRLGADPLSFVHRYDDPRDQEVAAVFAAVLAYGRVAGFRPTIEAVLDIAESKGGPRCWLRVLDSHDESMLAPLRHRWTAGADLFRLAQALAEVLDHEGSLGALATASTDTDATTIAGSLEAVVGALRAAAQRQANMPFRQLPRGFRYLLTLPSGGSACKRWCMLFRWMVRRPDSSAAGVDLGLWDLAPETLVIPLDTHIHRLSWFLGLTDRRTADWKTACEITTSLRRLHPTDPLRYDFALAHLGISGACKAQYVSEICTNCALATSCRIAQKG